MLADCVAGECIQGVVMITEWKEAPFRQKPGTFIMLTCQDRSQTMSGKIWEPSPEHILCLQEFDVVYLEGTVTEYRGELELTVHTLRPVPENEIDLAALLPSSPYTTEELNTRTTRILATITRQELIQLVTEILDDEQIGRAFRTAPAALKVHQAYLRGLWEHSVGVAEIALNIANFYPEVCRDLVAAGALLHDVGKIYEYNYKRAISATTEGKLLGHIILGVELLSRKMAMISDFPNDLRVKLLHILTSHHGRYEWQSPKRPKSMEALIIHHADILEADLWQFRNAKASAPEEEWSPYIRPLERSVYLR